VLDVRIAPAELIRGMPATLTVTVTDGSGAVVDPGTVTVTVTRHDGTTLFNGAASGSGANPRTVSLDASDLAQLDRLTVTAEASAFGEASAVIPVVGAPLFWVSEARDFDQGQLADSTRFPDDVIVALRARIREAFTSVTGRRFVPELVDVTLDGSGSGLLILPDVEIRALRAIWIREVVTWQELDASQLAAVAIAEPGMLVRTNDIWPEGIANVRVRYEAGMERVPLEIRRAALRLAASYMGALSSNLPDRALSLSDELGTFRLATPGVGGSWFGLPEVDAVLQRYRVHIPGVA